MTQRRRSVIAVAILGCLQWAGDVAACSPSPQQEIIFFGFRSADLLDDRRNGDLGAWKMKQILHLTERFRKLDAKCVAYTIEGYADTAEAQTPGNRIDISRAEKIKQHLVEAGVPEARIKIEGMMGKKLINSTGPGVREPQNRAT